jgi:predicted MPP superfamily phosphohydrolase
MSFLNVFIASLLLTTIVGAFMPLTWRPARSPRALAAFWGFALLVHLGWICVPQLGALAPPARWLAIMWLGGMLAALMLLMPFALLVIFFRRRRPAYLSVYLWAYVSCFLLSGIILAVTSTADFVVREETLRISGLPADLNGFRIANLGDVHIGRFIDAKELSRGIKALDEKNVDLLVVTGDLVDDVSQIEAAMQALELSTAPYKTVAILGNHEVANLSKILAVYAEHQAHITLLVNRNIAISRGSATLHIVGVDFPMNPNGGHMLPAADQAAAMSARADTAFSGLAAGEFILALSHHPAFFPFAAAHGAQLTMASHTHGGQIQLFGRALVDVYPYLQGVYRRGNSYLEVSAGFGHWLPIRFGVPREIVIVTLRADS